MVIHWPNSDDVLFRPSFGIVPLVRLSVQKVPPKYFRFRFKGSEDQGLKTKYSTGTCRMKECDDEDITKRFLLCFAKIIALGWQAYFLDCYGYLGRWQNCGTPKQTGHLTVCLVHLTEPLRSAAFKFTGGMRRLSLHKTNPLPPAFGYWIPRYPN